MASPLGMLLPDDSLIDRSSAKDEQPGRRRPGEEALSPQAGNRLLVGNEPAPRTQPQPYSGAVETLRSGVAAELRRVLDQPANAATLVPRDLGVSLGLDPLAVGIEGQISEGGTSNGAHEDCLLYTSDAADE